MTVTTFSELELDESLLNALESKGFTRPTAIQAAAIPPALEGPRCARFCANRHGEDSSLLAACVAAFARLSA